MKKTMKKYIVERWKKARKAYHANHDFYTSWHYLTTHPIFYDDNDISCFEQYLNIYVVKVNPHTHEIDDEVTANTLVQVWLETGPIYRLDDAPQGWFSPYEIEEVLDVGHILPTHDYEIDTGGDTFELAICELAQLVSEKYGDDRSKVYVRRDEVSDLSDDNP